MPVMDLLNHILEMVLLNIYKNINEWRKVWLKLEQLERRRPIITHTSD